MAARRASTGDRSLHHLRSAAAVLAVAVASLHLLHPRYGLARLVRALASAPDVLLSDPRPIAFVLSSAAIVTAVTLAVLGAPRRPLYAVVAAIVWLHFLGYFAWHLSGHGGFLPTREPIYHGLSPAETVVEHLRASRWASATKALELITGGFVTYLYAREGTDTDGSGDSADR